MFAGLSFGKPNNLYNENPTNRGARAHSESIRTPFPATLE